VYDFDIVVWRFFTQNNVCLEHDFKNKLQRAIKLASECEGRTDGWDPTLKIIVVHEVMGGRSAS
jgi:hypothetical protein